MARAPTPVTGDVTSCDPGRLSDAAGALREPLEFRVHHTALLCAQIGRAHGVAVEGLGNGLLRRLEGHVERDAFGQAAGARPDRWST